MLNFSQATLALQSTMSFRKRKGFLTLKKCGHIEMLATEYGSKKLDLYCIYVYTLSLLQSNEEKTNDYAC